MTHRPRAVARPSVVRAIVPKRQVKPRTVPQRPAVARSSAVRTVETAYWVNLASHRRAPVSRAMWARLRGSHRAVLGREQHRVVRVDLGPGKGVYYRLQVGPYATRAGARRLCKQLRSRGGNCFMVRARSELARG